MSLRSDRFTTATVAFEASQRFRRPQPTYSGGGMSRASKYRNVVGVLLLCLVLSRAGCSALKAASERRVENNPETYATGGIPTPETFGRLGLFVAMILMGIATVVFLGLWLAAWLKRRRPLV